MVDPVLNTARDGAERSSQTAAGGVWLLTFCDLMLLILTFFLMLYAMNSPRTEAMTAAVDSISKTLNPQNLKPLLLSRPASEPAMTAERAAPAVNLSYLRALLEQTRTQHPALRDMVIGEQDGQLVLSLPGDLLFAPGETLPVRGGSAAVGELAVVLARVGNRVAVAGHAEPLPLSPAGLSAWELSLARAASVATLLVSRGYPRQPLILGYGDGRPDVVTDGRGPRPDVDEARRAALARRVDIIILAGSGG